MVEERPRRRRKKGRVRAKKARPKKPPVLEDEQLPGLLEGEIPEEVPVTEGELVKEEPAVAEEEVVEELPPVVAEEEAVEEERPAVPEEEAISAEAIEEAVPAPEPEPTEGPERPTALSETLMSVPEFRQRVVQLVVRKLH